MKRTVTPNVCDIVEYGLDGFGEAPATYRVDAWLKPYVKPFRVTGYDMMMSGAMRSDLDKDQLAEVVLQPMFERLAANTSRRTRLIWCRQEDATHVSLSGICGAIAPISKCKIVGRVNWDEAAVQAQVDNANQIADSADLSDLTDVFFD